MELLLKLYPASQRHRPIVRVLDLGAIAKDDVMPGLQRQLAAGHAAQVRADGPAQVHDVPLASVMSYLA